ncbi:MAG: helix-turn-helix domain-containing protein [Kofleriaceae bacterium]
MKTTPVSRLLSVPAENDNFDRSDNPELITFDEHDGRALLHVVADRVLHGGLALLHAKIGTVRLARGVSKLRRGPGRDAMERFIDANNSPIVQHIATQIVSPHAGPASSSSAHTIELSRFLDEKQLCAELDISPVTATKWRRNAEGPPFVRVGRLIRYPRATFDRWLSERTVGVITTHR